MRYIIKRDGRRQEYNFDKIRNAVDKAFKSCDQETPAKFLEQLEEEFNKVQEDVELTIDEISFLKIRTGPIRTTRISTTSITPMPC